MSRIWRFYIDEHKLWHWQHLSVERDVVAQSSAAFSDYDACVTAATKHGYVHAPAMQKAYAERARRRSR